MSLLVLLKNRATGQPVVADDDDNEFLNIINCLSGGSISKSIRVRNDDNAFAAARFDHLGTANILEIFKNGASRAFFDTEGNLNIIHGNNPGYVLDNTDAAAARFYSVVVSDSGILTVTSDTGTIYTIDLNTRIITFNQQPVFPNSFIRQKESWFKKDPNDNANNNDQTKYFLAPSGASMKITKFSIIRRGGSHTAGGTVTWRLVHNGSLIGSGLSFNDANNAIDTEYSEALNVALAANDRVGINNTTISGTVDERDVTMLMEWEQKLAV